MNLGKSVYNLLKRQSEVYVNGLGTFKRNHTPSTFDEKRNVYLPPIDYIDFEGNSETGYDFVSYIQQLEEIDRSDAKREVQQIVDELLEKVKDQGQVKLDDLGYLVSYGEGYVFKALDLSGFNYEPVAALDGLVEEMPKVTDPAINSADVTVEPAQEEQVVAFTAADNQDSIDADDTDTEAEEYDERSSNNTIWYVLLAIAAVAILVFLFVRNQNTSTESARTDSTASPLEQSTDIAAHDSIAAVVPVDSLAQVDTSTRSAKDVLIPDGHTWQIVIGSHRTLAQAYEQAESYNKAGFPKVRVVPSNLAKNRKKVIWDSYETKAQLDSALVYVQRHIIKDAWPDKITR